MFRLSVLCLISINTRSYLLWFFLHIFSYVRLRQAEPVSTAGQRQLQTLPCLEVLTIDLVKNLAGVLCDSHLEYIFKFLLQIKTQSEEEGYKSGKVNFLLWSWGFSRPTHSGNNGNLKWKYPRFIFLYTSGILFLNIRFKVS